MAESDPASPSSPSRKAAPAKDTISALKAKRGREDVQRISARSHKTSREFMKQLREDGDGPLRGDAAKNIFGYKRTSSTISDADPETVVVEIQVADAEPQCKTSPPPVDCIELESPGIEPVRERKIEASDFHPYLWTVDEVVEWLERTFSFGHLYVKAFRENSIDGATLLEVTDQDLRFLLCQTIAPDNATHNSHLTMAPDMHRARVMEVLCQLANRPHMKWEISQCQGWLRSSFAFGRTLPVLAVDGQSLLACTDEELKKLGVEDALHRDAMMARIHQCRRILGLKAVMSAPPVPEVRVLAKRIDFWDDCRTKAMAGVLLAQFVLILVVLVMVSV